MKLSTIRNEIDKIRDARLAKDWGRIRTRLEYIRNGVVNHATTKDAAPLIREYFAVAARTGTLDQVDIDARDKALYRFLVEIEYSLKAHERRDIEVHNG